DEAAPPQPIDAVAAPIAEGRTNAGRVRLLWPVALLLVGGSALLGGALWGIKTKPKIVVESPFIQVRALCASGEFEKALDLLNGKALSYVNMPGASEDDLRDYFLLRAGALSDAQRAAGVDRPENNKAIISDFEQAQKRGATLSAADTTRLADAHLAMQQTDKALELARSLPKSEGDRRRKLIKTIVEHSIAQGGRGGGASQGVMKLLASLSQEPGLAPEDAAWTLARQAELLIAIGAPQEAVSKLLREMQLLKGVEKKEMGELYFLLGRADFEVGDFAEATRQLDRAAGLLNSSDPMQAHASLMIARILQSAGQLDEAKERYSAIITGFDTTPAYLPSLLGMASVHAALGEENEAFETYATLVEKLAKLGEGAADDAPLTTGVQPAGVKIETVLTGLMGRHEDRMQSGQTREAMRYAAMAESLCPPDKMPAPVLLALASSSRRLANELMGMSSSADSKATAPDAKTDARVDRASLEEAKRLFLAAGLYYERHAREVVIEDAVASARSRWEAADAYDAGGDTDSAIKEFSTYMQGASDDDARRPEASFRLAQAFQSQGDYTTAASLYRELIDRKNEGAASSVVLWGDRSVVPLAQCYVADGNPANDAEAEQRLLAVIAGRELSPEAVEFRDALVELGGVYYRSGRYNEAVERLTEAEKRFPKDRELDEIRYKLADSMRLSAAQIDTALRDAIPQSQRQELEKARRLRRREAMRLYGLVRTELDKKDKSISDLDKIYLRNAMFYQGDCAYDLGDYDTAIEYYDQAKDRFAAEPASLVAMVQIVNAYVQRGEWTKAATANQRAVQHLEKFNESAWAQPNLPMEKKHWARWLDSRALLEQRTQATGDKN
ncbi:MAG: tetratricopeptide repeat protein, partial [Pyrinomonadaceae bacterium]|nr:tetratricopeptide repeat protein [Phycisphaerales bacterium]